jgi:hypothetical protein
MMHGTYSAKEISQVYEQMKINGYSDHELQCIINSYLLRRRIN